MLILWWYLWPFHPTPCFFPLKVMGNAYSISFRETQPNYKLLTHHLIYTAILSSPCPESRSGLQPQWLEQPALQGWQLSSWKMEAGSWPLTHFSKIIPPGFYQSYYNELLWRKISNSAESLKTKNNVSTKNVFCLLNLSRLKLVQGPFSCLVLRRERDWEKWEVREWKTELIRHQN